jgi:hypothetical protein
MCRNEILSTSVSPSGELKAVVFNRNCGATTRNNTQISILSATRELPASAGNLFIMDTEANVRVTWTDNSSLTIELSHFGRIVKQLDSASGVGARYIPAQRSN